MFGFLLGVIVGFAGCKYWPQIKETFHDDD